MSALIPYGIKLEIKNRKQLENFQITGDLKTHF